MQCFVLLRILWVRWPLALTTSTLSTLVRQWRLTTHAWWGGLQKTPATAIEPIFNYTMFILCTLNSRRVRKRKHTYTISQFLCPHSLPLVPDVSKVNSARHYFCTQMGALSVCANARAKMFMNTLGRDEILQACYRSRDGYMSA